MTEVAQEIEATAVVLVERAGLVVAEPSRAPMVVVHEDRAEVSHSVQRSEVSTRIERPAVHVTGGNQGPAGIPGPPGPAGGTTATAPAGEALGGQRAVYIAAGEARYASAADDSAAVVAGITTGAVADGDTATYQLSGAMTEPSWNWTPELPVFLGLSGQLTQTPPAAGAIVELGIALTPQTIVVRVQRPAFLA
jgi:hypothetical protein